MPTTPPATTPMPAAPDPDNRSTFDTLAYPWANAQETLRTELGSLATNVYNNAVEAVGGASTATTKAAEATAAAAAAAANANAQQWVSGTTYAVGDVRWSPLNYLAYRRKTAGAGTTDPSADATNWEPLIVSTSINRSARTSNTVLGAADKGKLIDCTTGGWTQTVSAAATLGDGWYCYIKNSTTRFITLDPNAAELIDGAGVKTLFPDECLMVQCDGTGLNTVEVAQRSSWFAWSSPAMASIAAASIAQRMRPLRLDADRVLYVFNSTNTYGIVYNQATDTWGSAVTLRAADCYVAAYAISASQALLVSCTGTALEAVVLSIPAESITVETAGKATATITSISTMNPGIVAAGSSYVFGYSYANVQACMAAAVSGTTVTLGAQLSLNGTDTGISPEIRPVSATMVLTVSNAQSAGVFVCPVSVSGSTLTLGTRVDLATTAITYAHSYHIHALTSGRWAMFWEADATPTVKGAIITISGTTATASQVTLTSQTASPNIRYLADSVVLGADKVLFASQNGGGTSANILTDTAGVASVGTVLQLNGSGSTSTPVVLQPVSASSVAGVTNSSSAFGFILDTTGASPALITASNYQFNPESFGRAPQASYVAGLASYPTANNIVSDGLLARDIVVCGGYNDRALVIDNGEPTVSNYDAYLSKKFGWEVGAAVADGSVMIFVEYVTASPYKASLRAIIGG